MQEDDECDYDGNNSEKGEREVVPLKQIRLAAEPPRNKQSQLKEDLKILLYDLNFCRNTRMEDHLPV